MRFFSKHEAAAVRETRGPQLELCFHFFGQFFESEFVSTPGQLKVLAGGVVAAILSLSAPFAQAYYHKYRLLHLLDDPGPFQLAFLADQLFLTCGTMLVAGLATVLQWESLFPSRRDYLALAALPIRPRQIFVGKLAALAAFIGSILVAVAGPASTLPGLAVGQHAHWLGIYVVAIFVSCVASGAFVCLSFVALQGILLNALPIRFYDRISLTLQGFLLLALCASIPSVIATANLHEAMALRPSWMFYAPPLWFLGLNQLIVGNSDPVVRTLAQCAETGLVVVFVSTLLSYLWSYRRHRIRVLESSSTSIHGASRLWSWASDMLIGNPHTQAVFSFVTKTLARSPQHRLILTIFLGAGFALVTGSMAGFSLTGVRSGSTVQIAAIAIPLTLSLFTLAGYRFLFRLPSELRANWILRINEAGHGAELLNATDRFLYCAAIIPLFIVCSPIEIFLLGTVPGFIATFLAMAPAAVLVELLLFSFGRIPFTSSYFPGRRPLAQTLLFGGIAFSLYVSGISLLVVVCMASWTGIAVFLACTMLLWWKARVSRLETDRLARLEFEEALEPVVQVLAIDRD